MTASTSTDGGDLAGLRVLAVHAHPDDESLWTGTALAQCARRGAEVTVVTCTLGEEGEVIGDRYRMLESGGTGMLGGYRIAELREALRELGVNRDDSGLHRPLFLGGAGRWRDSGMAGTPAADHPRAFVRSGEGAVAALGEVIEVRRPHVVVTYGPDGGYGHPDHIRAHEVTHAAVDAAVARRDAAGEDAAGEDGPDRPWVPALILWAVTDRTDLEEGLARLDGPPAGWRMPDPGELASVPSTDVDLHITGTDADVSAKRRAMAAHATQLWIADGTPTDVIGEVRRTSPPGETAFCLSNLVVQPLLRTEAYTVGGRDPGDPRRADVLVDMLRFGATDENRLFCLSVEGRRRT
ncbi:N-acetyl-1-D-myo-inositol-2-amino-2-deoxy-alpha-D-glucopyranoside deacetylase [Corynebacterium bovis]|uniref:1D-myo-inositol 2-acetamido-2-deoxy-alpha-D-glucopyranoside deacetylase n=1 Tax=Corynebacterium bovis TaxID=36808 RepID=A0A426Q6I7_9CORY|nr:N-acetyl-1-D-myo-inositol-2-amino-2-deoxy-alpha-D-glucopyranoside deacetylase [Corynebacterium bovis]RRO93096.1 N-acetyl-1-D-myo-inositol-2-amino-2-deoxy-alpha-D-glucopyranoside deacetylase [Corynebacterium bovis]RRO96744.1 N-acetyl-1-D-myo-inositol-2-amino-2-deoxy-alpha-D-glucopyranoside deacetylase [Corynebacterium bovis]RRO98116.1 N-acetyl-1-D-myo-inositol-2-amino-2-deoxy-alpha-D-glucopyranoside deacetylase [Corynebacterium bovis]RRQ02474.1 N-acetyl-1-D-myo-inositol-2-amino-2-deoxy-alpha-